MATSTVLREHLVKLLEWEDAHAGFEAAVANLPDTLRGQRPAGLPYSPWQLLEHLRITQHDILDFCVNSSYRELKWPDEYWPRSPSPASGGEWEESVRQYRQDRVELRRLARDPKVSWNRGFLTEMARPISGNCCWPPTTPPTTSAS